LNWKTTAVKKVRLNRITLDSMSEKSVRKLDKRVLISRFQSGFRRCHSTETAIMMIFNDVLSTNGGNKGGDYTSSLYLSVAFEAVHRDFSFSRLETDVCVKGTSLLWFRSYLSRRNQVATGACKLSPLVLLLTVFPRDLS